MSLRVRLTEAAKEEVRSILSWIKARSATGAASWREAWLGALATVAKRGASLAEAPESDGHDEAIRQILFKTRHGRRYRALFVIREDVAFVLHVRGPGQDLMKLDDLH